MIKIIPTMIVTGLIVFTVLIFSNVSFAQTYTYVNTSGNLQNITANSPTEAINNATNRSTHSGVMIANSNSGLVYGMGGPVYGMGTSSNLYLYVNTSGNLQSITANSPTEAINNATNRSTHSGVMTTQ